MPTITAEQYLAQLAAGMLEETLLQRVRNLGKEFGWRHYHTYNSKRSNPGFPDWTAVRKGRLIFAELKREGKSPTEKQREWLDDLADAGVEVYVWRPSDLLSGRIAEVLK